MKDNLKKAYLNHSAKLVSGQSAWVRTANGWCHMTRKESLLVAKQMIKATEQG